MSLGTPLADASPSPIERVFRHDRLVVAVALGAIFLLTWLYLVRMARVMDAAADRAAIHVAMGMSSTHAWSWADMLMLFVMWSVMMAGMMILSAAPVILLTVGTFRRRGGGPLRDGAHLRLSADTWPLGPVSARWRRCFRPGCIRVPCCRNTWPLSLRGCPARFF